MIRGSTSLVQTKSLLAKLMAQENITVLHENLPTAYFDLNGRELHCPIWENISPALYDLLMGHEISHALNTPKEGWHSAICKCTKPEGPAHKHEDSCYDINFKDFLNVCEDARIERIIKRVFPGLKKSFAEAYQELWVRDFFGVKDLKDFNHLMLIDRINLHFKIGAQALVRFSNEEKPYVDQLEKAETWEQVEKAARALYKFSQTHEQDKQQLIKTMDMLKKFLAQGQNGDPDPNAKPQQAEQGDQNEQGDGQSGQKTEQQKSAQGNQQSQSDKASDKKAEKKDAGHAAGKSGKDSKDGKQVKQGGDRSQGGRNKGDEDTGPRSITDRAFRKSEEQLVNKNIDGYIANVTLPRANLQNIVYGLEEVVKFFETAMDGGNAISTAGKNYQSISTELMAAFQQKNKGYINMLIKEFEMRKNATQYYRAKVSRTGEVDSNLLSRYKFSNDIFRRITETPKGKNHGLVMFLDMSGSMDGSYMRCAVEQIITLVTFCQKVRIPFDVYGFADQNSYTAKYGQKFSQERRDVALNSYGFHLRTLASSTATVGLQKRALRMLATFATQHLNTNNDYVLTAFDHKIKQITAGFRPSTHNGLHTHGTPLCETIVASRALLDKFKLDHKSDIVSCVFLTDGDGSQGGLPVAVMTDARRQSVATGYMAGVVVVDPITKNITTYRPKQSYTMMQDALTTAVGEVTGCRLMGFYIGAHSSLKGQISNRVHDRTALQVAIEQLQDKGYVNVPVQGFHSYYYVSTQVMSYNDTFTGNTTAGQGVGIENLFRDNQKRKSAARTMLGAFANEIATQDGLED